MKPIAIIIFSLTLMACSACNRKPAPPSTNPGSATVTVEGSKVITTSKDANGKLITIIAQPTPPENYPKDVPTFSEGNDSTYTSTSEGGHITLQSLSSKSTREVADYFGH